MHHISEFANNQIMLCALLSWFIAQVLKIPTNLITEKRLDWKRILGSGGMPSSHTSFVVALTIMVGAVEGFGSALFAVSFTLAAIVMYDATGVRRETGTQAQVINKILRNVFIDGKPISEDNLKELVGHTPLQVLAGILIGIGNALLMYFVIL